MNFFYLIYSDGVVHGILDSFENRRLMKITVTNDRGLTYTKSIHQKKVQLCLYRDPFNHRDCSDYVIYVGELEKRHDLSYDAIFRGFVSWQPQS